MRDRCEAPELSATAWHPLSMAKGPPSEWRLDGREVDEGGSRFTAHSGGKSVARTGRSTGIQSAHMTLRHRPTGIQVEGSIDPGHYSRKQMAQMRDELRATLWSDLEGKVARHLRIPGRRQ